MTDRRQGSRGGPPPSSRPRLDDDGLVRAEPQRVAVDGRAVAGGVRGHGDAAALAELEVACPVGEVEGDELAFARSDPLVHEAPGVARRMLAVVAEPQRVAVASQRDQAAVEIEAGVRIAQLSLDVDRRVLLADR